jgi:hypothetical protein
MTDESKTHALVPGLELKPTLAKVGKMLAMLGSDNETDRMAAATAIYNVTKRTGLTPLQLWQMGLAKKEAELRALVAAMLAKDVNLLLQIGQQQASYFCNDAVHADVDVRGHRTTYKVESKAFEKWLLHEFFVETERAPARSAIKSAIRTLAAIAEFGPETPRHLVNLRTAEVDGRIYIDLHDEQSQCVMVDENSWRIIEAPPVRFRHTPGMRALPVPLRGGSLNLLRQFTNLNDGDFVLFVVVLLDAFRSGKHPILNLVGEFATSKSTLAKLFKRLIDPDDTELRSLPSTVEDMFVAVDNARVRAWDNVSKIERTISDALCELSDGSGFGRRKRYTDGDEYRVQGSRSIILTGLTDCATRPDLSSRTVKLSLQPIKEDARRSEVEFWSRFDEAYPSIFGALLDALAYGLKNLPNVRLDNASRMKDFELFGHACEEAFAPAGSFAAALAANAVELNETLIEEDPVAKAIVVFMVKQSVWSGTTTKLMVELQNHDRTEAQVAKQRDWPKDAIRFSHRLREVAATLRRAGIEVTFDKAPDRMKTRTITLRNIGRSDDTDDTDDKTKSSKGNRPAPNQQKSLTSGASKKKQRPQRPTRPSVRKLPSPTRRKRP